MSLNASLSKFKSELADTASRNINHTRPTSTAPARISTPKPSGENKRTHEIAFSQPPTNPLTAGAAGNELLTQVVNSVKYLKEKDFAPVPFDNLISYLSLPNDAEKNIPLIKRALQQNERVEYVPKSEAASGKESFKYRPLIPVTNADELKDFLARQPTAQGVLVRDIKDGWPDCVSHLDALERAGSILIKREKKDNAPKILWTDNPAYHTLNPVSKMPQKADQDFMDFWAKVKLPANEVDIRLELEKAGLTPTSVVKETRMEGGKRKEKRRVVRRGGKTTNSHMLGILKDYSKR